MSRFKFRTWDKKAEVMEQYHYLQLSPIGQLYHDGMNVTDNYEIMQYTGLKDKNDKEIYEGDIVRYLDGDEWSTESGYDCEEFDNHGVIFFDEECGRYDVTNKQGISYDDLFDCGVDFEIIGNIYENPELIKN
ncbi:YopX family protein [Bacillus paranthracis]|uniref:YopX protein domain-containing protein n=5 Tax=root TaxID=1 RepID=B5LPP1_9CAUD|nr:MULTISPECIES: YopX family protein [Bacillus cereus group]YP_002154355.1 YopX family protein [Bacillus phage IEBH]YP_009285298.1 YopX family protein [Bacillus phage PfEFR-5]YP_009830782.1 YopX family protein [Bacillus phage PfEFR-4]KXI43294.1 hypothetical protein ACS53_05805 [Bacillus cereus]ACH42287.1 hypothetical protein [Bacillus phage IEBH]ANT40193.1 YopX protein [Bacillus phage PfEFR-4]ANT40423.1 YopX protein [Bacillus phage PfEFR-5]KXI76954.1 hypothetical protein ACS54_21585 [Bacill